MSWKSITKRDDHTETLATITGTSSMAPCFVILRTVSVGVVFVTNIVEEVDPVFRHEECDSDGMYGCIAPTLHDEPSGA